MTFGLLGYPLSHSFSRPYFTEKFARLGLSNTHQYLNFEMEDVAGFQELRTQYPDLRGCNVTIPHKQAIIPYLDALDPVAARIGAVNCIRFDAAGRSTGFNTDYFGFRDDLLHHLREWNWTERAFGLPTNDDLLNTFLEESSALVLGTGGASLAVHEALRELGMSTLGVSRTPGPGQISYEQITPDLLLDYHFIINTTPLGMAPKVDGCPALPYAALGPAHFCYDLVYNPAVTRFLEQSRNAGAAVANGQGMLERQAEAGWKIWENTGGVKLS
ncbi:shikimate dehydrogenase [Neolewinella lacunae]|uniref:Shikimate dehydrogenase n=1 Tax=Neolewinella lacunae TaxID=1517758 RepID=A0A923PHR0_9BACT|nr:shikimate dehydrogenase [Neolewinella lacunae]MBC6992825.1 shikimate dehydrogenase [Neolewinella lacunae]MDN3636086.1 shikimate dehydrogenase [Neolewinella lacunae]